MNKLNRKIGKMTRIKSLSTNTCLHGETSNRDILLFSLKFCAYSLSSFVSKEWMQI